MSVVMIILLLTNMQLQDNLNLIRQNNHFRNHLHFSFNYTKLCIYNPRKLRSNYTVIKKNSD